MAKALSFTLKITSCMGCPHMKKKYTAAGNHDIECWHPKKIRMLTWPGTSYAPEKTGTLVAEACERPSEYPKVIPDWCPMLKSKKVEVV